jgi:hypothetical protein
MSERDPMLQAKLSEIQQKLKAPKSQFNKFGGYEYRSCEDILTALKPLLGGAVILLADEIVQIGERYYVKATATLREGEEVITTTAFAREEEIKKGMSSDQVTGSASSYARKYALNGLFAIDDTKDSDTTNTHDKPSPSQPVPAQQPTQAPVPQQHSEYQPDPNRPLQGAMTDAQNRAIFGNIKRLGITDVELKAKFGIPHISELSKQQASDLLDKLFKMQTWE